MTEKKLFDQMTSEEVFAIMEKRSVVGVVLESIQTSSITRTKENYQKTKELMHLFSSGVVDCTTFQQELEKILDANELILVTFRKKKKNGKIGKIKPFKKGFYYYIGKNPEHLSKVYVHWGEEKKFLIENICCLKSELFFVEKQNVYFGDNLFHFFISLYSSDKKICLAEISLYAGIQLN